MGCWRSRFFLFAVLAFWAEPNLAQVSAQLKPGLKSSPGLIVAETGAWRSLQKGMEFRSVTLERTEPYQLIHLKIVRFDAGFFLPQILRGLRYNVKSANVKTFAQKTGALATINANYFDEQGKPLGFLKTQAYENSSSISKSSLFTGIFGIKDRSPFIVHRDDFTPGQADEALQAGPLLLSKGAALPVTRGAGKQSRRSLIGLDKERRLTIAITDSLLGGLSWVEMQEFFSFPKWEINMTDILNLDGGGSAQLYVRASQFEEHVAGTSDVPVAIGFFQK